MPPSSDAWGDGGIGAGGNGAVKGSGQRLGRPVPGHWAAPGAAPSGWWGGVAEPALTWTRAPQAGQRLMASAEVVDTTVHLPIGRADKRKPDNVNARPPGRWNMPEAGAGSGRAA